MIIQLTPHATAGQIDAVVQKAQTLGLHAKLVSRDHHRALVVGRVPPNAHTNTTLTDDLLRLPGVQTIKRASKPFKLASREAQPHDSVIRLPGGATIGGSNVSVIAGPCGVESLEQMLETAEGVKKAGAIVVRASLFKPRTSPYEFQGLGEEGLDLLREVKRKTGVLLETEVMHPDHVALVEPVVDLVRVGARNMQNFDLLRAVGQGRKPVILKRGLASTIKELLLAAEYILDAGNPDVILCERGIRTFETETRNTLDLNAVPVLKQLTHLPVIVDPSHGTGRPDLVLPMSRAAIACGADGLIIEVHRNPPEAKSDAAQQLTIPQFEALVRAVQPIAAAVGRTMPLPLKAIAP